MSPYHVGQWVGALILGFFLVGAVYNLAAKKLIEDETLALAVSGIAAFCLMTGLGYFGYADGRPPSLAYVPLFKYVVACVAACLLIGWKSQGKSERDRL